MFNEAASTADVSMFHSSKVFVLIPTSNFFTDAASVIEVEKHRVTGKDSYEGSNLEAGRRGLLEGDVQTSAWSDGGSQCNGTVYFVLKRQRFLCPAFLFQT